MRQWVRDLCVMLLFTGMMVLTSWVVQHHQPTPTVVGLLVFTWVAGVRVLTWLGR